MTHPPPTSLNFPDTSPFEATSSGGASVTYTATAVDLVSGPVDTVCSPAPSVFPLGRTVVSCSAKDAQGNSASGAFAVTVADTTPPSLKLPDDFTVEATSSGGASVTYTATAVDLVSGPVDTVCSPAPSVFPLGRTVVSCSAKDAQGNSASGAFAVTVADTTPPSLKLPDDFTVEATSGGGASVTYTATAVDLVSGPVDTVCSPAPSVFPLGRTVVGCSAKDAQGNSASGAFAVTVADTTPPALKLPDDFTVEAT